MAAEGVRPDGVVAFQATLGSRVPCLEASGIDVPGEGWPLGALLADPSPRRCPTPIASDGWIELLGSG